MGSGKGGFTTWDSFGPYVHHQFSGSVPCTPYYNMQSRFGFAALALFGATAFFYLTRTKSMASNAERSQVAQEDTTPQQQELQNPEPAPRTASNALPLPVPFLSRDDLAKAQGKPGGGRITLPVQPPVNS